MRINLPEPCHENWSDMSLLEKGRHCQKCNKEVYDFTSYSDAKLLTFFKSNSLVCGRFRSSQIGRELDHKLITSSKWAIAACSIMLLSSTDLQAQTDAKLIQDSSAYAQIQMPVNTVRIIQATFDKTAIHEECISKMRMKLNGFSIELEVDSSNSVSITIPQTKEDAKADFDLFNHHGDSFHIEGVEIGLGTLWFSRDKDTWIVQPLNIWKLPHMGMISPELVTMGIPAPMYWQFPPIDVVNVSATEWIYPIGDTVLIDTPDIRPAQQVTRKPLIKSTKKDISIAWIAGISTLLFTAVLLAWRRFGRKFRA